MVLYQKINVTRSTICVENFILVSQTVQGWHYAALIHFNKNCYNSQAHAPIWLKFGKLIGDLMANHSSKYEANMKQI